MKIIGKVDKCLLDRVGRYLKGCPTLVEMTEARSSSLHEGGALLMLKWKTGQEIERWEAWEDGPRGLRWLLVSENVYSTKP